jgi:hypothetical protein
LNVSGTIGFQNLFSITPFSLMLESREKLLSNGKKPFPLYILFFTSDENLKEEKRWNRNAKI